MPLSNKTIMSLNEVTTQVRNKKALTEQDEQLIKDIFGQILQRGEWYDTEEIGAWFENEGSWPRPSVIRITNMSHYVQTRFQQRPTKLKMVSDESCGCD